MIKRDTRSTVDHLAQRSMRNGKPFRTAAQKAEARATARIVEGRHVSSAPVSHHGFRGGEGR